MTQAVEIAGPYLVEGTLVLKYVTRMIVLSTKHLEANAGQCQSAGEAFPWAQRWKSWSVE